MAEPAIPSKRRSGLGRGLDALLGDIRMVPPAAADERDAAGVPDERQLRSLAIASIEPDPDQPRRDFPADALDELAASIAARGVIQPIIVRRHGTIFRIIAGERRWRAAQKAQLHEIPAIVRAASDGETLEIALIENVQREDLNPIEEAEAYARLTGRFGHSVSEIGQLVGKSRSHVTNLVRLLELPEAVIVMVREGALTMGHARALINHPDAPDLARRVAEEGLSVRQVEQLVRAAAARGNGRATVDRQNVANDNADVRALESHLSALLGLRVAIEADQNGTSGALRILFSTLDQLDLLCQRLSGESF